jgi:hypothetical protein
VFSENRARRRTSRLTEFKNLYDVAADVVSLPEFIQSEFSKDTGKGRKFGKLRGVKTLKKPETPAGTKYTTEVAENAGLGFKLPTLESSVGLLGLPEQQKSKLKKVA